MRWYLNPLAIRSAVRDVRRVQSSGGPRRVRLENVGRPEGWFLPSSTIEAEVVARDGTRVAFSPELPVPWPLAYGYRAAGRLTGSLLDPIDPTRLQFEVGLPCGGAQTEESS